jgi:hypothetical protein
MVPTPTDRMEFRKSTRDLKAQSAAKEHSSEVRGGGRDPGVGRPGAGPGRSPASSKFVRSFLFFLFFFHWIKFWHVRNPLPQSIRLRLSVLVRHWAGQGE